MLLNVKPLVSFYCCFPTLTYRWKTFQTKSRHAGIKFDKSQQTNSSKLEVRNIPFEKIKEFFHFV